ncbi:MAG: hypothetical protein AB1345_12635 [Chloroflexota bacterium]
MSPLSRLLRALGFELRRTRRRFDLDADLLPSLQYLAARERLPLDEVASDLVAQALDQRQRAEFTLELWHGLSPREQEVQP